MTPSQALHAHCGAPAVADCGEASGRCYVCAGEVTRGMRVDKWAGASFTGQNRVRNPVGEHLCESCVWVMSRTSPVPGRPPKPGKKLGGNFRNYTHLFERPGLYANASKGEKPAIREWLAREKAAPWFAAVADSGQKHVIPWAPWNGPGRGGAVLFDEQIVVVPDDQSLVERIADLLTLGATKEEVARGDYRPQTWARCWLVIDAFEIGEGQLRGSAWFTLALWLAQRDEDAVTARLAAEKEEKKRGRRKAKASRSDGGGGPRAARGVPANERRKRAQALGHAADAAPERGEDVCHPGGAGDPNAAEAGNPEPQQRRLPGVD